MKNILLLTSIYPNNDSSYPGTKVCHTFTKEWAGMGYNVRVVHFESMFPRFYNLIGSLFGDKIRAKTGVVAYTKHPRKITEYTVDGVSVIFAPIKKWVPHKNFSERLVVRSFESVCSILENEGFVPDVVTGHFVLPQLEMLNLFKNKYPQIRTCLVLHGDWTLMRSTYPDRYGSLMNSVDVWGFRSLAFQKSFEKRFGKEKPMFLCHSGIPEQYIENVDRDFSNGVKRFVFVGSLYELKNVDITLRALHKAMAGKDYIFDIVGSGAENVNLHRLVNELGLDDHVVFHGQMKRDDAQQVVRESDCFSMVSSREAFGLVYVEAMAKGCIVVGTKGQGIDGIVKHGVNGFLCKARDVDGLAEVIKHIINMPHVELQRISLKAVATAIELTDRKVAENYLKSISNK